VDFDPEAHRIATKRQLVSTKDPWSKWINRLHAHFMQSFQLPEADLVCRSLSSVPLHFDFSA
jgi:hypothetical protein